MTNTISRQELAEAINAKKAEIISAIPAWVQSVADAGKTKQEQVAPVVAMYQAAMPTILTEMAYTDVMRADTEELLKSSMRRVAQIANA